MLKPKPAEWGKDVSIPQPQATHQHLAGRGAVVATGHAAAGVISCHGSLEVGVCGAGAWWGGSPIISRLDSSGGGIDTSCKEGVQKGGDSDVWLP